MNWLFIIFIFCTFTFQGCVASNDSLDDSWINESESQTVSELTSLIDNAQLNFDEPVLEVSKGTQFNLQNQIHIQHPYYGVSDIKWYVDQEHVVSVVDQGVFLAKNSGQTNIKAFVGSLATNLSVIVTTESASTSNNNEDDEDFETNDENTTDPGVPTDIEEPTETPNNSSQNEIPNLNEETLNRIEMKLNDTYFTGDTVRLKANLYFDSGTVYNVSYQFTTPQGKIEKLTWQALTPHAHIQNGNTVSFDDYGATTISASFQSVVSKKLIDIKVKSETPKSYSDRFLGYDDFPGYESWAENTCPPIHFGENGGYASHLCPEIIMNQPFGPTHVVSLGQGGYITLEFHGYYPVDGEGPDLTIFENPLLSSTHNLFAERAEVSVSQDGHKYFSFECDVFDPDFIYEGCAGVNLVNMNADWLNPSISGGDTFDLADLDLSYIRFIRIKDLNTCMPGDPTYSTDGSELCEAQGKEGFDLDALVILNGHRE